MSAEADTRPWRAMAMLASAEGPAFVLFGTAHCSVVVGTLALAVAVSRVAVCTGVSWLARSMAMVLAAVVLLKPTISVFVYDAPWTQSLPLDLCRINEMLCVYLLLRRSYRVFEVAYFLAVAGSGSAILMPDLTHGFPDPRFLVFFVSHGVSVLAILYAVFGYGFRPTWHSVKVIFLFLSVYTIFVAGVNLLLDSNYLFLRSKPEGASVLDYFGPWPWYLFGLIGLAITACLLCYLPFALRKS